MVQRISTALKVSADALERAGAFDRFVEVDSQLHVDPHLLRTSQIPEMVQAADALDTFWADTVLVLKNIFDYGDRFWREAIKRLTFPENANMGLGYARGGTSGLAVGRQTADGLVETARQIVRAGITDPKVFELVGLMEPKVGPDLLSDITVHIIEPQLLAYTERVCRELGIATREVEVRGMVYPLPFAPESQTYLILTPKDILRELPVAFCWEDVDKVCAYNEALRARMNALIGENWRRATEDNRKEKLKQVLLENPAVLSDLVQQYRAKPGEPYDFAQDILGETIWPEAARTFAEKYPLNLKSAGPVTSENLLQIVRTICDHFRRLVEDNRLCRFFWTDDKRLRHERFAQMFFFAIADAYCKANELDLSPEANSGRGPVDFKISRGYSRRVLVELKWSTNKKLVHGFETQLAEYEKAEGTNASIFLVIQVSDSETALKRLSDVQGDALRSGKKAPDVKIIDGRPKDSASHMD